MASLDEQLITEWVQRGVVSEQQAATMRTDVAATRSERSSNKLIATLSTIGAILLGVGAILFVAANWQEMSRPLKQTVIIGSTFLSLGLGYWFQQGRVKLVRVGGALLFLSALLFGATLALLGQMYHLPANAAGLILVWLLGVAPLTYVLRTSPLAALSGVLAVLWVNLYAFNFRDFNSITGEYIVVLPSLLALTGTALFAIGRLHARFESLAPFRRMFSLIGLKVTLIALFFYSFGDLTGIEGEFTEELVELEEWPPLVLAMVLIMAGVAVLGAMLHSLTSPRRDRTTMAVVTGIIVVALVSLLYVFAPTALGAAYPFVFNALLIGISALLIWIGYTREDLHLVNLGLGWVGILIAVRYVDWFWELLPRSGFFLVGGVILVGGSIYLERTRRWFKKSITEHHATSS